MEALHFLFLFTHFPAQNVIRRPPALFPSAGLCGTIKNESIRSADALISM